MPEVEPSREELLALVAAPARAIEQQAQRIERLEFLVVELLRRLGRNSRNSSKPPSSDSRTADPDVVIDHLPEACRGRGSDAERRRATQVLRFTRDLAVPFTNNQAVRDLRPTKTQLTISGCHLGTTGATAWLRVRRHISTARKHGINAVTRSVTPSPAAPGHH